jgi:hypothetical protein
LVWHVELDRRECLNNADTVGPDLFEMLKRLLLRRDLLHNECSRNTGAATRAVVIGEAAVAFILQITASDEREALNLAIGVLLVAVAALVCGRCWGWC